MPMFMQKKDRHNIIISVVEAGHIAKQDVLAQKLAEKGVSVTQASISRDLDELGITKTSGYYELPKVTTPAAEFGLKSLEVAGDNMLVGRCDSGLASAITVRIDSAQIPEIIGTIAGDDTIFIAVKNPSEQAVAIKRISYLFSH